MSRDNTADLWNTLIGLNKSADDLIAKVMRSKEQSQPISREIPFFASVEARFDLLPATFQAAVNPGSDAVAGSNIKLATYENAGSRVYIREIGFEVSYISRVADDASVFPYSPRTPNNIARFPINFRWNFQTSITEKWYSRNGRCLARAGGRPQSGSHIAFREPRIIEPREGFRAEFELISFGMTGTGEPTFQDNPAPSCVISMLLSGYREGI